MARDSHSVDNNKKNINLCLMSIKKEQKKKKENSSQQLKFKNSLVAEIFLIII